MQKNIYRILCVFIFCTFLGEIFAQVEDNFSDGDFTENPTWIGDESLFMVNSSHQLQLNDVDAGKASLVTEQHLIANSEWRFWIRMPFAPSNNNFARVYLAADKSNLKEPLNGYYLQFGENGSNDAIELYRQTGTNKKLICRGKEGAIAASFTTRVKVTCDVNNRWRLFADMTGGTAFLEIGSGEDVPFFESQYMGVFCQYTKSNATKFYFDDFYAGAISVDNEPPDIQNVTAISSNTLQVVFNEVVSVGSAENVSHYSITPNDVTPVKAILQSDGKTALITLSGNLVPRTQYVLTAQNISDMSGNVANNLQGNFSWVVSLSHDILINEIMAHPSPTVGLPNAAYVELFNNTEFTINLNGWSLVIGNSTKNFGDYDFLPQHYLILCHNNNRDALSEYGECYGFSSFSLTYGGTALTLYNSDKEQIAYVHYSDTWYGDNIKKNGGWSLERIDPANGCDWAHNWTASVSSLGGTPGAQNSVFRENSEVIAPKLLRANYVNEQSINVFFNKTINSGSISDVSLWNADQGLGHPKSVTPLEPDFTSAAIVFNANIEDGKLYSLTLKADEVVDCSGLPMQGDGIIHFGKPEKAQFHDILINEIMAHPSPTVGLPDAAYVELFNNTDYPININGWTLVVGNSTKTFEDFDFGPRQYLILCHDNNKNNLSTYGNCYSFSSFSLTHGGTALTLYTREQDLMAHVRYSDTWYGDNLKKEGGWSLERIDADNGCDMAYNWTASKDTKGGTPGAQNSVLTDNPEVTYPELLRAEYVNETTITVYFNKSMNSASIADIALWSADHGLGTPTTVTPETPDFTTATIVFNKEMENNEIYTLTLKAKDVVDCGNVLMQHDSEVRFGKPFQPEKYHIIINEVLFQPTGLQYVELYNRSSYIFDTKYLRFTYEDNKGKQSACKVPSFLLFPDDYAVLTKHKEDVIRSYKSNIYVFIEPDGMPTLSTSTGNIWISMIADSSQVIDAMRYNADMHSAMLNTKSGVSLERISAERPSGETTNWHSAAETAGFGTPGYKNSQFDNGKADNEITIDPEVFTPNNDGVDDYLNIRYKFDESGYVANVYIYNATGKFVRRLANNVTIGTEGAFSWDGKDENNKLSNAGIYIIVVEIFNLQGKTKQYKKTGTLGVRF